MKALDKIIESYPDETFLKADGFDDAIIGVEPNSMRLVYSVNKCLKILLKDMTSEEALKYFNYNVLGCYMGDKAPIWCEEYYDKENPNDTWLI